ncbi:MAG: alpha/beta fold hydrolase [Burkholderiaceae bacterium]
MDINIRRFGPTDRQVLGLLQCPLPGKAQRAAFLMCRPFGQEAVRTSPIYRAMSDRLAREGCTVLTIDLHGCGDSPGEADEQSLAQWADDVLAAHQQLRLDAPGVPLHWFGMGLGASVAAGAAARCEPAPDCLVLWEPVLDGPGYLRSLLTTHRAELAREMQRDWLDLVTRGAESEPVLPGSVLGFTIGIRLHEALQELRGLPLTNISERTTRIVMALAEPQLHSDATSGIPGLTLHAIKSAANWMSIEARGTAIVPQEIPNVLLATLRSESP